MTVNTRLIRVNCDDCGQTYTDQHRDRNMGSSERKTTVTTVASRIGVKTGKTEKE
jgi:hypothetical protein